jgi:hypothetical protein
MAPTLFLLGMMSLMTKDAVCLERLPLIVHLLLPKAGVLEVPLVAGIETQHLSPRIYIMPTHMMGQRHEISPNRSQTLILYHMDFLEFRHIKKV